ncbi:MULTISPECIES: Sjogren's syndrome/scleroderma autoantigen 1 family protein [Haloferax]|uniref:Sjogren's syndrome/scleroderma autoantigen 1 (Autoantigen p27) n=2 Tax=Haloferax TaxID=2251 RepID=A0A6G1Z0G9_9EURY|nr:MULTISPECIES: Sjogren's syndrome/scleroderma autoantigen 1 family protein [Haloferax]KAB1187147.1 hypothetical protein Hfx1149_03515 [Haloferax sp. CBA1149]MRW79784.1 hypothetical protein [Haloferax marinisediminis]
MSEFDKEAERQRLREKYERDEEKRRSTQRMSELLLKGATMTNKHCDQCGDPIFRYDGQEFCPTCQTQGQAAASADEDAESAAEAVAEAEAAPETAEATNEQQTVAEPTTSADATSTPQPGNGQTEAVQEQAQAAREYTPRDVGEQQSSGRRAQSGGVDKRSSSARQTASGDVSGARESLVRTLTWAAEQAESTDDPRRAKEFLAAAREAAEAIAALDR